MTIPAILGIYLLCHTVTGIIGVTANKYPASGYPALLRHTLISNCTAIYLQILGHFSSLSNYVLEYRNVEYGLKVLIIKRLPC